MDVNSAEWSQSEFRKMAEGCSRRKGSRCNRTTFACKDYLCPFVKKRRRTLERCVQTSHNRQKNAMPVSFM